MESIQRRTFVILSFQQRVMIRLVYDPVPASNVLAHVGVQERDETAAAWPFP